MIGLNGALYGFGPLTPSGVGEGETRCGTGIDCGCCEPGQWGLGCGIDGPRVPRKPFEPYIGDMGVEHGEWFELNCVRGPDIIGGGDGAHGDGGR